MPKLTALDRSMAKVYSWRVKRGELTIDEVPERIRELVAELANAN